MSRIAACTTVYADELPHAVVLANSFRQFHPESAFVVLVIDGERPLPKFSSAEFRSLADIGLERGDEWRLPMLLDRAALRTRSQTILLESLRRAGAGPVAWFSPFTRIFAPLTDIFAELEKASAAVATEPMENEFGDQGRSFIGIPPGGAEALQSGEFTTIREPGFAVHYANLDPAGITRSPDGWQIENSPLRSFDFRGYDPAKPHLLSRYQGFHPRILLSEFPLVAELCDGYRKQLVGAGYSTEMAASRRFEVLPGGLRLDERIRRIYREALANFQSGNAPEPPSPFGPGGEKSFITWLNEPIDRAGQNVTRFMFAVYEDRPDVKSAFPDPINRDALAFRGWYINFGATELDLPAALVPSNKIEVTTAAAPVPVNVAGYFRAELGIGTAARALVAALEAANIPINTVTFDQTANRLAHPFPDRELDTAAADTNIICVNPDQIGAFADQVGPKFFEGRYNIGVWFWEVEDFPSSFHHAFNYVDEIWVASEFMRQSFLKVSSKPVFKFTLPVPIPTIDASITRARLNLPDNFLFLFSFDFLSVLERKNPLGLIEAFTSAFAPDGGPRLLIKSINGDKRAIELEKLKYASRGRPDILLMDGYLGAVENATLTALSDCYVSLHRSEGFGLTMAEAMALGKPVIATAYSGNLEFMTADNSYLCPAFEQKIGPEREPYPADSTWADPDIEAAARLLVEVYKNPGEAAARGRRGAKTIHATHSAAAGGSILAGRIATVRQRRASTGPVRSVGFLQDQLAELKAENARLRGPA